MRVKAFFVDGNMFVFSIYQFMNNFESVEKKIFSFKINSYTKNKVTKSDLESFFSRPK